MKNMIPFIRRNNSLSQLELARKIGVSPSYLCKIEKSVQDPSDDFIDRCCTVLNVSRDELFPERVTRKTISSKRLSQTHPVWLERKKNGLKQCELAEKIQCSPSYLCKVENRQVEPTEFFKKECARVLQKRESELFPE